MLVLGLWFLLLVNAVIGESVVSDAEVKRYVNKFTLIFNNFLHFSVFNQRFKQQQ